MRQSTRRTPTLHHNKNRIRPGAIRKYSKRSQPILFNRKCAISIQKAISADGFTAYARRLIEELKRIGKTKTAKRFAIAITSLARYTDDREIAWSEFNATLISGYEEFLLNRGLCRNSTSYYMRNLRAIANRALEDGHELPRNPFKHVYIGVDKTIKRAVTLKTIQQIRDIYNRKNETYPF